MRRWVSWVSLMVCAWMWSPDLAVAQTRSSGALVKELITLFDQYQLHAVASRLSPERDRFAAALYLPDNELLTVRARYAVPVLLQEQIYLERYRDAYLALNGAGSTEGKLFVEDVGADGLAMKPGPNGRFDIIYQEANTRTLLNGDWKSQSLSEQEYKQRFAAAEQGYAQTLASLIDELKKSPATPTR
jgi:hypothetical protein